MMERLIGFWALVFVRPMLVLGVFIAAIGVGLVLFAGGYFIVGAYGQAGLDSLTVTQDEAGLTQDDLAGGLWTPEPTTVPASRPPTRTTTQVGTGAVAEEAGQPQPTDEGGGSDTSETITEESGYDEYGILRDLNHYVARANDGLAPLSIRENFRAVTEDDLVSTYGEEPRPQHIIIPAIGLESSVVDLSIVWDGETSEWETADHAVGFHIGSATPGEVGNTVMSGHVNSPIAGEGSVFARLDEIAPLLRRGKIVDIIVTAGGDVFLYRATDTTVVLPEDVDVFDYSDGPTLSLVTCAPATTYSHRFIVNATLVGVSRL